MKLVLRLVKIVAVSLGALALTVGIVLFIALSGGAPISDGQRLDGVEAVKDGFVSAFIVEVGENAVALIDTGKDPAAGSILRALGRRNLGPDAVKAILLTHGDRDHTAGVLHFPGAEVMALAPEVPLVEGRALRGIVKAYSSPKPNGIHVARALQDGEMVTVGQVAFQAFAVPGHSEGSAAYLARSVLFLGDSAESSKDGKLGPARRIFTDDTRQNRESLRRLAVRLEPSAAEVKAIAFGHSGMLTRGLAPLTEFAEQP
jgi:glyoxylase-like metal-dependent hydrolase (beta-lactamase superfamily II)